MFLFVLPLMLLSLFYLLCQQIGLFPIFFLGFEDATQDVNGLGLGRKKECPNPTQLFIRFGSGRVKSQYLLPKPKPVLGDFVFGLGWVGMGCMDPAIFGLFKGSETFFGAKTTTQSSNCLPKPNPISFQVGSGGFC
jgi:hypothetical protein